MMLSDKFHDLIAGHEEEAEVQKKASEMVLSAPDSPERSGLLSLIYHEGMGVDVDLDKSFEYAEKASDSGDGLGYFMLGYMCDNAETPDQAEGGPRQKYDHYDAERFYEKSAEIPSRWQTESHLWLGDYFMNMARGGDPDEAVEHYEAIANENAEAAGKLSDYYWDLIMPLYLEDKEWRNQLFKWTTVAAELNPEEYLFRLAWIYADGLGCEPDMLKAIELFENCYNDYDDWRGAKAIATLLQEYLDQNPDLPAKERAEAITEISSWTTEADRLHDLSLTIDPSEFDPSLEED